MINEVMLVVCLFVANDCGDHRTDVCYGRGTRKELMINDVMMVVCLFVANDCCDHRTMKDMRMNHAIIVIVESVKPQKD